jgi:hypothetical protein
MMRVTGPICQEDFIVDRKIRDRKAELAMGLGEGCRAAAPFEKSDYLLVKSTAKVAFFSTIQAHLFYSPFLMRRYA